MTRFAQPLLAAVAALVLAPSSPARAAYTFQFNNVSPGVAVSFQLDGVTGGDTVAGRMMWSQPNPAASAPGLGSSFWTFCVELNQDVYYGATYSDYTVQPLTAVPSPGIGAGGVGPAAGSMGSAKAASILSLFGYLTTLGVDLSSPTLNRIDAAAAQIAVWEIVFEDVGTAPWNATSGEFRITSTSADSNAAAARANAWLQAVAQGHPAPTTLNVAAISSPTAQDQLVVLDRYHAPDGHGAVVPVPAPTGVLLSVVGAALLLPALGLRRPGAIPLAVRPTSACRGRWRSR